MERFEIKNAPCQSVDPEIFFPDPTDYDKMKQAKSLCKECVRKTDCLDFAIATRSLGIWGGTTEIDRRSIVRKRQRSRQNAKM